MINFIQPYNPEWRKAFESLKQLFCNALKDFEVDIQHVGSTAVAGLCAKPILDIDIILKDKTDLTNVAAIVESMGYKNKGEQGIPGRFAFRQIAGHATGSADNKSWPEQHLYVCYGDSVALKNHLIFRDLLVQNKTVMEAYAQLKITLANTAGMTREKYTILKTDFILKTLAMKGLDEKELNEIKMVNL